MTIKKELLTLIGIAAVVCLLIFGKFYLDALNKVEILTIERDYFKKSYEETRVNAVELLQYIKNKE